MMQDIWDKAQERGDERDARRERRWNWREREERSYKIDHGIARRGKRGRDERR
jgi:hypothetical protein